jgi:hypothetical protein
MMNLNQIKLYREQTMSALKSVAIRIADLLVGRPSDMDLLGFIPPDPLPDQKRLQVFDSSQVAAGNQVVERICCALGGTGSSVLSVEDISRGDKPHRYSQTVDDSVRLGGADGYIYTRFGGLIDLGHARDIADYTASFGVRLQGRRLKITELLFKEGGDFSLVSLARDAPLNVAVAALLGAKLAYERAIWHEIVTFFPGLGSRFSDQQYTSFSPEDNFSNALGALVGYRAFLRPDIPYSEAVDSELVRVLLALGAVEKDTTKAVISYVKGLWWDSFLPRLTPTTKRKNLQAFSPVRPWLATDIAVTGKDSAGQDLRKKLRRPTPAEIALPTEMGGKKLSDLARLEIKNFPKEIAQLLPSGTLTVTSDHFPDMIEKLRAKVIDKFKEGADQPGPPV